MIVMADGELGQLATEASAGDAPEGIEAFTGVGAAHAARAVLREAEGAPTVDARALHAQLLAATNDDARDRIALDPRVLRAAAWMEHAGDVAGAQELRRAVTRNGVRAGAWDAGVKRELAEIRDEERRAEEAAAVKAAMLRRAADAAEREVEAMARAARQRALGEDLAPFIAVLELPGGVTVTMEPGSMTASVPRERNDGSPGRPQVLPLLNAAARVVAVVEERTAPDAEPTGVFRVGFALKHGVPFTVDVRAEDFDAFGWLTPATRGRVFIPSDDRKARGFARVAIIATAGAAERVQRRAFLGWERAPTSPAGWMFAHAGGALGAGGPVEGFDVRPPDALARYRLPAPPDGNALRAAALAVLDFAEAGGAAGARVILPCLGATLRAALGPVDKGVTVYLAAPPGVGKSYLASLCQRFYGAGFGADAPPVSFLDKRATDAGAALLLAAAGDVLVWCDDAKDTGVELASRVVHMHFNRAVDAKGRRDGSLRVAQRPRATVLLVTGELAPRGHSVRQRAVMIDMPDRPGDLSRFDALASAGVFAEATSAIITWHLRTLAGDAGGDLDMMRRTDRDAAKAWDLDGTGREGELFGPLANGLVTLATWLEEILPEQGSRIEALRTRSREALSQVFGEQSAHVAEEAPAVRVVELLASAIAAGSAHVAWRAPDGRLTSPPAEPTTWGWRPSSDGLRGEGERVGVILPAMGGAVALNAATALRVAARMARDLSHPLPMDTTRLGAALYRAGLLAFAEERATGRRIAVDPTALPPVGGVNPGCRVRGVEGGQQRLLLLRPEALGMGFDLDVGRVEEL